MSDCVRTAALGEPDKNWTGAPRSPQRTWAENDVFRLLLLVQRLFARRYRKSYCGLPPDFLLSLLALSSLMRLSLLKAAHVDVGECHVAGNPGRLSFSAQVRWGERGAPALFPGVLFSGYLGGSRGLLQQADSLLVA